MSKIIVALVKNTLQKNIMNIFSIPFTIVVNLITLFSLLNYVFNILVLQNVKSSVCDTVFYCLKT